MSMKNIIPRLQLTENDIQWTAKKNPQRSFSTSQLSDLKTQTRTYNGVRFDTSEQQSSDRHISIVYQDQNQLQEQQVKKTSKFSVGRSQQGEPSISARLYAKIDQLTRQKQAVGRQSATIDRRLNEVRRLVGEVIIQDQIQISRIKQRKNHQIQRLHTFYQDKIKAIQGQWEIKLQKVQTIFQNNSKNNRLDNQDVMERVQKQFQEELRNLEIEKINIIQAEEARRLQIVRNHHKQIAKLQAERSAQINRIQTKHKQQIKQLQNLREQDMRRFEKTIRQKQEFFALNIKQKQIQSKERQAALKNQLRKVSNDLKRQASQLEDYKNRKTQIKRYEQGDSNYQIVAQQKNSRIRMLEEKLRSAQNTIQQQLNSKKKAICDMQMKIQNIARQFQGKISQMKSEHVQQLNRKQTTLRRSFFVAKPQQGIEGVKREYQQKINELTNFYQSKVQDLNQQLLNSKNQTLRMVSKIRKEHDLQLARREEQYRGQMDQLQKICGDQQKYWQINYEEAVKDYSTQLSKRRFMQNLVLIQVKRDKEEQLRKRLNEKIKQFAKVQAEFSSIKSKHTALKNETEKFKNQAQFREAENKKLSSSYEAQVKQLKKKIQTLSLQLKQKEDQIDSEIQKNSAYEKSFYDLRMNLAKEQLQRQKNDTNLHMRQFKQKIVFLNSQHQAQTSCLKKNYEKLLEEKDVKYKLEIKCLNQKIEHFIQKLKEKEREIQNERKNYQKNLSIFIDKKNPERAKSYDTTDRTATSKENSLIIQKMPQILQHTRKLEKDKQKLNEQLKTMRITNRELRNIISTSLSRFQVEKQMTQEIGQLRSRLKYFEEIEKRSPSKDRNGHRSSSKESAQKSQNNSNTKISSYQVNLSHFKSQNHELIKKTYFRPERKEAHQSFEFRDRIDSKLMNPGEKYFIGQKKLITNNNSVKKIGNYQ